MGILDYFMLRVPKSTAKWTARHFKRLHRPGDDISVTFQKMIDFRYSIASPGDSKQRLIERSSNLDNLTDFTHAIMWAEGINVSHLNMSDQSKITFKIADILREKGIQEEYVVGNLL